MIGRTRSTMAAAVAAALGFAGGAVAVEPAGVHSDRPVFWTWQEPLGPAAGHPQVIELVRVKCNRAPEDAADGVVSQIRDRGLRPGEIGIVLQNFGMGGGHPRDSQVEGPALFAHWCDALAHRPRSTEAELQCIRAADRDASPRWWDTPWMTHGIAESRAWMTRFVERYREHQAQDPSLPDPDRFHFDTEERVVVYRKSSVRDFLAIMEDDRWDSEPLPGFGGRTLAELYADAGSPGIRASARFAARPNHEWAIWYGGVLDTVADAAMNEAAYAVVRDAWPSALSSNYGTSARYDGKGTPRRVAGHSRRPWLRYATRAFGDLQAPVLYFPNETFHRRGETPQEAAVRWGALKVNANVFSYDGPHADVTPWIHLVGQEVGGRGRVSMDVTEDMMRDMMIMLRAHGVREMMLWSDDGTQDDFSSWRSLLRVIDQVWQPRIAAADMVTGEAVTPSLLDLRHRWRDMVRMSSAPSGSGHAVELRLAIDLGRRLDSLEQLRLDLDARGGGVPTVRALETGGGWADLTVRPGVLDAQVATSEAGASIVSGDSRSVVRIRWESHRPFTVDLDLAQATIDAAEEPAVLGRGGGRSHRR